LLWAQPRWYFPTNVHGITAVLGLGPCAHSNRPFDRGNCSNCLNLHRRTTATPPTPGTPVRHPLPRRRQRSNSTQLSRILLRRTLANHDRDRQSGDAMEVDYLTVQGHVSQSMAPRSIRDCGPSLLYDAYSDLKEFAI
jgi:hypothetical protein